jgi:ATP-binding cassette subfamily B protein/ATP-binding cassette subfamily C protein
MYLMVFRQGQSTFTAALTSIGGMYEDNLYLSNLYEFLEQTVPKSRGKVTQGIIPGDGIRFEKGVLHLSRRHKTRAERHLLAP